MVASAVHTICSQQQRQILERLQGAHSAHAQHDRGDCESLQNRQRDVSTERAVRAQHEAAAQVHQGRGPILSPHKSARFWRRHRRAQAAEHVRHCK